jgi:cytochrome P450
MTYTATESAPGVRVRRINYLSALGLVGFVFDPIETMRRAYDHYGPLVEFGFHIPFAKASQRFLLAVGPRYNERVLGDPATFGSGGLMLPGPKNSAQRRIRAGIVAMDGLQHEHYRQLLLPPLRRVAIDGVVRRIGEIVQTTICNWRRGAIVDLWPLVQEVARRSAAAALFGARTDADLAEALAAADLLNDHTRMAGSPQVRGCPIDLPGTPYRRMLRHAEEVESHLTAWAAKRRGELCRDDLLSLIVNSPDQHGRPLGDEQIANQVLTLFGASYETCQTALAWTLFLLAQHPDASAALYDEVSSLREPLCAAQLEQCTWLGAVVKEGMRLFPPIPLQVRKAFRDTDLLDCDVKRRTRVILSPFLTNRLPDRYPQPDRFTPERWSRIAPSQYEYLVFSAGPRTCIGYWFAMTFLKIALAHIMRAYRLTIVPGARIDYQVAIAMWPSRGIPVVIHAQDCRFAASPIGGSICQLFRC